MKTMITKTLLATAAFGALAMSTNVYASGLIANILRPVIGNKAADRLDEDHARFKDQVPVYKAIEERGSAAVRMGAAGAAVLYGGPVGLVLGQAALNQVNNGLHQAGRQYDGRQVNAQQSAYSQADPYQWQRSFCASHGFANYDPHTHQCFSQAQQSAYFQADPYQGQRSFCASHGFANYNPYTHQCFH